MAKEKKKPEQCEEAETEETTVEASTAEEEGQNEINIEELTQKAAQADEYLDKYQRTLAEYDNFRKRTAKEKEQLTVEAKVYVVSSLLPILDNLERAETAAEGESDENPLKTGVQMIIRSVKEEFEKLGVCEIEALGTSFDPNRHNAVMHIEDETVDDNTIVEVFQKGYTVGDRVIRAAMVKVAN